MTQKAVFAGTFDPPTLGHLDVLSRVYRLFDEVLVVIANNPLKQTMFSASERVELFQKVIKNELPQATNIRVLSYKGLIVNFCQDNNVNVLIRGLRIVGDFEAELQMATVNRKLNTNIETLHIMTDERFLFISSTIVREVARFGGSLKDLAPPDVEHSILQKLKGNKP